MGNEINKIDETAETIKETKQKGICPFCNEVVAPVVVEKNRIGRDRCVCPNCNESVYLCRTPSCHDYAKCTESYDHQFCPACTKSRKEVVKEIWDLAKPILVAVGGILAGAWATRKAADIEGKGGSGKGSV